MSYVLDGIKTALRVSDGFLRCPCGYALLVDAQGSMPPASWSAARFHFTHCTRAWAPVELCCGISNAPCPGPDGRKPCEIKYGLSV